MATQETPSVDDLEPVDTNMDDAGYDSEWIELDAGEDVVDEIRDLTPTARTTPR